MAVGCKHLPRETEYLFQINLHTRSPRNTPRCRRAPLRCFRWSASPGGGSARGCRAKNDRAAREGGAGKRKGVRGREKGSEGGGSPEGESISARAWQNAEARPPAPAQLFPHRTTPDPPPVSGKNERGSAKGSSEGASGGGSGIARERRERVSARSGHLGARAMPLCSLPASPNRCVSAASLRSFWGRGRLERRTPSLQSSLRSAAGRQQRRAKDFFGSESMEASASGAGDKGASGRAGLGHQHKSTRFPARHATITARATEGEPGGIGEKG